MAAFQGVFATYQPAELPGLIVTADAPEELSQLLERLVEDEGYKNLSASVHTLGFPQKRDRALQLARRFAQDVLSRRMFKHLLGVGTKAVETATSVPLADSHAVAELIGTSYLPPLVSLEESLAKARRLWKEQAPPFVPPDGWNKD